MRLPGRDFRDHAAFTVAVLIYNPNVMNTLFGSSR